MKKFDKICFVGIPKTGTSYFLEVIEESGYKNIVGDNVDREFKESVRYKIDTNDHVIMKNPLILWNLDIFGNHIKFFNDNMNILFVASIRQFDEAFYSLYRHWYKNRKIPTVRTLIDGKLHDIEPSLGLFFKQYGGKYIKTKDNILRLNDMVDNLVLLDFDSVINKNPYEIIEDLNIDFEEPEGKRELWTPHTPNPRQEEEQVAKELIEYYENLKKDKDIQKILYKNEKFFK